MTDQTPSDHPHPAGVQGELRSSVRPMWNIKFGLFLLVGIGLGVWGLVDALVLYPKRGQADVGYQLYRYLDQARVAGQLPLASVEDPHAARQALLENENRSDLENARFEWLNAIAMLQASGFSRDLTPIAENNDTLGPLVPDDVVIAEQPAADAPPSVTGSIALDLEAVSSRTAIADPTAMHRALDAYWQKTEPPKPLSAYDLPSQWVFVLGGIIIVFWIGPKLVKVNTTTYRYRPETKTLVLPSNDTISPENLEDVDGRKWDKYYLFVTLAGETHERKIDLYRWVPLEDWLAEITHAKGLTWPGDSAKKDDAEEAEGGETSSPDAAEHDPARLEA